MKDLREIKLKVMVVSFQIINLIQKQTTIKMNNNKVMVKIKITTTAMRMTQQILKIINTIIAKIITTKILTIIILMKNNKIRNNPHKVEVIKIRTVRYLTVINNKIVNLVGLKMLSVTN
jgi:hypothetical protein